VKRFTLIFKGLAALALLSFPASAQNASSWREQQDAGMNAAQAEARVIEIVNQPVTHLPRTDEAAVYSPGWFHPGAITPDFDTVDVRKTQDASLYAKNTYVTSDLNPNEMFYGDELEFNAMTKYFYQDRSLPKKKLSEAEMLEINQLYRIIGRAHHAKSMRIMASIVVAIGVAIVGLLLVLARRTA
jgi:hypothetical protein